MVYYISSIWRYWIDQKVNGPADMVVDPPNFCQGLDQYLQYQNTSWVPDITQVPILAKWIKTDTNPGSTGGGSGGTSGGGGGGPNTTTNSNKVRNPDRLPELVGSSPLALRITSARVADVLRDHGAPPVGRRNGTEVARCVKYHAKGACSSDCPRVADHQPIPAGEKQAFLEWCQRAFPA